MFVRDAKRILRAPKVWPIVLGLIVLPSLYAWFNIIAFWDPYSNTKDVNVAVVNLDKGASNELMGEVNVGEQVVAQLKDNDQLGWKFLDEDEAMRAVKSGSAYAAIVIPAEFSADLLTIGTDKFIAPKLDYYTNEKANAIAPKITDVGASTLDTQINGNFISTVAQTIATDLEKAGVTTGKQLLTTQSSTVTTLDNAVAKVQSARVGLNDLKVSLSSAQTALTDTKSALTDVNATITDVQTLVAQAQTLVAQTQQDLITLTNQVTGAYMSGSALITDASSQLNGAIAKVSAGTSQANAEIGSAINDAQAVIDANNRALDQLQALLTQMDPADPAYATLQDAVNQLQARIGADQQLLSDLETLSNRVSGAVDAIQASADQINQATKDIAGSAGEIHDVLTNTLPEINSAMSALSASAGAFSAALDAQTQLVTQSIGLLTGLQDELTQTVATLDALDGNLSGAEDGLKNLRADVAALSTADIWNKVRALTGLDPDQIAQFMASPVQVNEHDLFPVSSYGSAMAPLFTNLSLWIGAFMLVVLMKQEADPEGIEGLTIREAYLGRWALLAVLNIFQVLLVSIGNIVIGVQMASAAAFVATCVFTGLVYLAIIYAIAVSFGYVGKGIIILLVIMQIPGASGIYPIEMMPGFFRALFPFFPFTYGINAMRETIGGFYDGFYLRAVAVLALYAVLAFILGLFLRQRLGNFSRLFNTKLADTGLFVSEDVRILGSRRRLSQMVQAYANRDRFRRETAHRSTWFNAHHLTLQRLTLLVGVVLTIVLGIFAAFLPDAKATILGLWGLVLLVAIGILVSLEYIKQNITFASRVGDMPDDALREAMAHEEAATRSIVGIEQMSMNGRSE